jgi:hypothetical protein
MLNGAGLTLLIVAIIEHDSISYLKAAGILVVVGVILWNVLWELVRTK